MRRAVTLVLVLSLAWSSIEDNAAVCADQGGSAQSLEAEGPCSGEREQGSVPHTCVICPCRVPTTETPRAPGVKPGAVIVSLLSPTAASPLHSADAPAPPTPPPNHLV